MSRRKPVVIIAAIAGVLVLSCGGCLVLSALLPGSPTPTAAPIAVVADSTATSAPSPTATAEPTDTPAPTATLSPIDALRASIVAKLGECNREGIERVATVALSEESEILVQFAINDNLFADSLARGARRDVANILRATQESGLPYAGIEVQGTFAMQDVYGNISERVVVTAYYTPEIIDRINWEHFDTEQVYVIAELKSVHRDLR